MKKKMASRLGKKEQKMKFELQEIIDNIFYVTDKSWQFELEDGVSKQFGVLFEINDMAEATGEEEFLHYPFLVSASIMPDKVHPSFSESADDDLTLIYDAYMYAGGVPIDHDLVLNIVSQAESTQDAWKNVVRLFDPEQATVKSIKQQFGTWAAQQGKDKELKYLQFKTYEDAKRFVDYLVKYRLTGLGVMIGFILDRPINMAGDTGWSTMQTLVKGSK